MGGLSKVERGKNWEHKYSLDDSQSGNHGLLIPPLRGLRVVSGSVQKQHGNRGREDRS